MPDPTLDQWRSLFQAAEAYRVLMPWDFLTDQDLFAVENPADGTLGYCCVMGAAGEEFGLAVFVGDDGLAAYRSLMTGDSEPDSLSLLDSLRSVSATFVDRKYLQAKDRKVITQLGLKFRGHNAWPLFLSQQPGYAPWQLEREEALFLELALRGAIEACKRRLDDDSWLTEDALVSGRVAVFRSRGGDWERAWRDLPPETEPGPGPPIDEVMLRRLRRKQKFAGTWEVDFSVFPGRFGPPNARPQYAVMLLVVDSTGVVIAIEVLEPASSPLDKQERFTSVLENAPELPTEIRARNTDTVRVIEATSRALGIAIAVGQTPALDEAMDGMLAYLDR